MNEVPSAVSKRIAVVGGGPGGYVAAIRAAQLGAQVTLLEKNRLGGTCLNIGCIPTKCFLRSAELAAAVREEGALLGVTAQDVRVDFQQVVAHKDQVSGQLVNGVHGLLRSNRVRLLTGTARFAALGALELLSADGRQAIEADAIILATGSGNAVPPIDGLAESKNCIDSTGALALRALPDSMVIVGGGVIGVEMACAFARLGSRITVVEAMERILPMVDADVAESCAENLRRMGIALHLGTSVVSVRDTADGVAVLCREQKGGNVEFQAGKALFAVGRKAETAGLELETGGVAYDRSGIRVNARMETSCPRVYAVGDCVSGYARLAHTASAMGETAAENALGLSAVYEESVNPSCIYAFPEIAYVGLTEEAAAKRGISCTIGRFPMAANGRALILSDGGGFVKIIADKAYAEILGVEIIGPHASELIAEAALAIGGEMTCEELANTIHSHPTVSEALREAALDALGRAVHIPPRRR